MHATHANAAEALLVSTLLALIVIVLVARAGNVLMRRMGQPGAIGEIVAGLLLGPSFLGAIEPDLGRALFGGPSQVPIQVMSQIGLIFLMFQIGSDFEFGHLTDRRNRRTMYLVAAVSVLVPLISGLALGQATASVLAPGIDPFVYSLFFGVAMAITAVPILGRILKEFGLTRQPVGVIAISAAAINDVVGWLLLAAVSAVATAAFSIGGTALQVGGVAGFAALLWFVGRPLVDRLIRAYPIEDGHLPGGLMALVMAMLFGAGICTYELGIFAIFGGFAVGLLFHRHPAFVAAWQRHVGQFVLIFFLPIFFTFTGLRTNVLGLASPGDWASCLAILAVAIGAKIVPIYLAARATGFGNDQAATLGVLMNTRALMELIVLNVGFDLGYVPQKVFTMLVIMAVATTIMTGPLLRALRRRAGLAHAALIEA